MSKAHILLIPSWYPHTTRPLSGVFFREQAIALREAGYRVGVVAPIMQSIKYGIKNASLFGKKSWVEDSGVSTLRCELISIPKLRRINMHRWMVAGRQLVSEYIRVNGTPDIIHAHSVLFGGVLANEVSGVYGIPYLVTEHSTVFARGLVADWQDKIIKHSVTRASALIAVSSEFRELLEKKYPVPKKKWKFIPNLVNTELFSRSPSRRSLHCENEFIFFAAAFLTEKKGMAYLLQAMAQRFRGGQVRLWIAGDGEDRDKLELLSRELGISDQVNFLGRLDRENMVERMSWCDAFVLPSLYETFGVVVIEALALGKPVVATRCGGPESIINDLNGYLVPVADSEQLGIAMERMLLERGKFDPVAIRQDCINRFGVNAVISSLGEVYRSIIDSK